MPDDFAQDTSTTGVVSIGDSATGEIATIGDIDWFAVSLRAGKTYRFELEGSPTGAGTLENPYLRGIHNSRGSLLPDTHDDNGGAWYNSRMFITASLNATHYVAVGAWRNKTGSYKLSVEEVNADDYADNYGNLSIGSPATGEIERPGDRDRFALDLEAGKTYRIEIGGTPAGDIWRFSGRIYEVRDSQGAVSTNITRDASSRIFFTPKVDDTYSVEVGAVSNGVSGAGSYALSVQEVTALDDHAAGIGTTSSVPEHGITAGEIEQPGDRDWLAVSLDADTFYRIQVRGKGLNGYGGTLDKPRLIVYDSAGKVIEVAGQGKSGVGQEGRLQFMSSDAGTYYIGVEGSFGDTGAYTLSVKKDDGDDYGDDTGDAGALFVGGSATGEIEVANDRDWFAVELVAGKHYRIDLEGVHTGQGDLVDPYLRGIYGVDGSQVPDTINDDGGESWNSRIYITPSKMATYYIAAGAYGRRTGDYTLSVEELVDDYPAAIGTDIILAAGDTATGAVDYPGDQDWFAVTLTAGKYYRIHLEGSDTDQGTLQDPYLHGIYDADGDLIAGTGDDDGGAGRNSFMDFVAPASNTYYIAAGAHHEHTGAYYLSVHELVDDYPATTGTSAMLTVGSAATGEIERPHDQDWFAVELIAEQRYKIDLQGLRTDLTNFLDDPYLYGIHDSDGNLLPDTTNDDGGPIYNSSLIFAAPETALYYLSAGAYETHTGAYTILIEELWG